MSRNDLSTDDLSRRLEDIERLTKNSKSESKSKREKHHSRRDFSKDRHDADGKPITHLHSFNRREENDHNGKYLSEGSNFRDVDEESRRNRKKDRKLKLQEEEEADQREREAEYPEDYEESPEERAYRREMRREERRRRREERRAQEDAEAYGYYPDYPGMIEGYPPAGPSYLPYPPYDPSMAPPHHHPTASFVPPPSHAPHAPAYGVGFEEELEARVSMIAADFEKERSNWLMEREELLLDARGEIKRLEDELERSKLTEKHHLHDEGRVIAEKNHLEREISVLRDRNIDLQADIEALRRDFDRVKRERDEAANHGDLEARLRTELNARERDRSRILELEDFVRSLETKLEHVSMRETQLRRDEDASGSILRSVQKELAASKELADERLIKLQNMTSTKDLLQTEVQTLKNKLKHAEQTASDRSSDFDAVSRELARYKTAVETANLDKDAVQTKLHAAQAEISDLQKNAMRTRRELEETAFELASLKRQNVSNKRGSFNASHQPAERQVFDAPVNSFGELPARSTFEPSTRLFEQPSRVIEAPSQPPAPAAASSYDHLNNNSNRIGNPNNIQSQQPSVNPSSSSYCVPSVPSSKQYDSPLRNNFSAPPPASSYVSKSPISYEGPAAGAYEANRSVYQNYSVENTNVATNDISAAVCAPFGTDVQKHTEESLEKTLLALSQERDEIEGRLAKCPSNSMGRTAAERRGRLALDSRLGEIHTQITRVRQELRKSGHLKK